MASTCHLTPLAASDVCEVWMCRDCGAVHLACGPIRFRLTAEQFSALAATFGAAMGRMRMVAPEHACAEAARH